jgi:predicted nucleic acid-binding protein
MILVDSSVWIDHIRAPDERLVDFLSNQQVLMHPYVIGEVALGHIRNRAEWLSELGDLPGVAVCRRRGGGFVD